MRKGNRHSTSITQLVRDFSAQNPSFGQSQIVRELVSQGHKVYPGLVSQALKRGAGVKNRKSSKPARKPRVAKVAKSKASEVGFQFDQFKAAANFVKLCGGVDKAIASIRSYEKIVALFE